MARRDINELRGILTGASSGIGRALATQLVKAGARILAIARRHEKLLELQSELAGTAGTLEILAGDVTDPLLRSCAIEQACASFGGLDLLINNAGVGARDHFESSTPERLRQIMEVNFFSAVEMIRLALPELHRGRAPIIVNVSSILGHRGIPLMTEYCASKFALQGFSESLRAELAAQNIDVLVVSPGTTATEFFEHALENKQAPWGEQGSVTPDQVACATIRAMRAGRHEVMINVRGRALVLLNRLLPRVADRVMARYA